MQRRQFLHVAVAGTVAFSLPGVQWLSEPFSRMHVLAHPGLLTLLGDDQRVREIGSAYRRAFPKEDYPETLRVAILSDSGLSQGLADSDVRTRLDQQVRDDFERGRTVQLRGWILSVTEARQCALFSILYP